MSTPRPISLGSPVGVVGVSARAAAASLRLAGLAPRCVDAFADLDLQQLADQWRVCPFDRYPDALPELLDELSLPPGSPVVLTGAMENHLAAAERIAAKHALFTPGLEAMRAARDPHWADALPQMDGIALPETKPGPITRFDPSGERWLVKPRRSGGGRGVRVAAPGDDISGDQLIQKWIDGVTCSVVFVVPIAGEHASQAVVFGVTRLLPAEPSFGTRGFRYTGNLAPIPHSDRLHPALSRFGESLVEQLGLGGVFGVDFILGPHGVIHPIEINPRFVASVEVIERLRGQSIFSVLLGEALCPMARDRVAGKAVVHATADSCVGDLASALDAGSAADLSAAGTPVRAGHPICTVLAEAEDETRCVAKLRALAQAVYTRGLT